MGIYDREYYRREGPSYLGAWADSGKICKWLVAINAVIFIIQVLTAKPVDPTSFLESGAYDPTASYGFFTNALSMKPELAFYHLQLWRFVTGVFLHDPNNWWHLVMNMLMLWFFGRYMEDLYGHKEFLAFYILAGVVGNVFWGLTEIWAHRNMTGPYPFALGASGAVMGVMVLCTLHYPFKTLLLWWFIPVPFWLVTVLYVGGDLYMFLRDQNFGVAVAAHLGGAAFGLLYQKLEWRLTGGWSNFFTRLRRPARTRLKIYREEQAAAVVTAGPPEPVDEQLEAKADAVLEKLSQQGPNSLTAEERDILQRASEQYRKKRK